MRRAGEAGAVEVAALANPYHRGYPVVVAGQSSGRIASAPPGVVVRPSVRRKSLRVSCSC